MNLKAFIQWSRRINQRLLLAFLLVALIPISIMAFVILQLHVRLFNQEVEARQVEVTAVLAQQINSFTYLSELNLTRIGLSWYYLEADPKAFNRLLADFMTQNRIYTSITLIRLDGQETNRVVSGYAIPENALRNRGEEELFFRPLRGETYYSNVRFNDGEPQISLALPIRAEEQIVGVIAADINLQAPWAVVHNLRLGEQGYASLVDARGNLVTSAAKYEGLPAFATTPAFIAAMQPAAQLDVYRYRSPLSSAEVIGSATPIQGPDWYLVVERPTAEAFQAERQLRQASLWLILAALIAALMLSALVSHQITRPLYALREVTRQFGRGDLSVRSQLAQSDEIGELANTFNAMADRLEARIVEINEKNTALSHATAQATEANRLKDEFLAIMSHELRTPLNAILGFTGILLLKGQLSEQQTHLLERIEANSERLLTLINDILDVSRIQAGRWQVITTELAPTDFVQQLIAQTRVLADNKNLKLSADISPTVPARIIADEDALTKIITNLLSNAIKFTAHGGVTLRLERRGDYLRLEVQDTGIGIPGHLHQAIFEQFRQADSSSTRVYGGTGLGLAIVSQLCEVLGGRVWVESVEGAGATFFVELPCVTPAVREVVA